MPICRSKMVTYWQFHMIQMIANQIPQVFIKEWVRNYGTEDLRIQNKSFMVLVMKASNVSVRTNCTYL